VNFGLYFQTTQYRKNKKTKVLFTLSVGLQLCSFPCANTHKTQLWNPLPPVLGPVLYLVQFLFPLLPPHNSQSNLSLALSSQNHFTLEPPFPVRVLPMSGWMEAATWKHSRALHPGCTVLSDDSAEHTCGSQCAAQVRYWKQNCGFEETSVHYRG